MFFCNLSRFLKLRKFIGIIFWFWLCEWSCKNFPVADFFFCCYLYSLHKNIIVQTQLFIVAWRREYKIFTGVQYCIFYDDNWIFHYRSFCLLILKFKIKMNRKWCVNGKIYSAKSNAKILAIGISKDGFCAQTLNTHRYIQYRVL